MVTLLLGLVIGLAVPYAYAVILLGRGGQTIGKKAMGIRVETLDGQINIDPWTVLKREVLGKFVSGAIFGIGYLVVLFEKRAWHDRIAETKVMKVDNE